VPWLFSKRFETRPLHPYNYAPRTTSILLVFNINKEISPLTTAPIIILSLSFLPLNDGHNSGLLLFSAEPVFAQLSRQAIPYAEQQVSTIPSSSFISSMAN
jgi:hypothetical protein